MESTPSSARLPSRLFRALLLASFFTTSSLLLLPKFCQEWYLWPPLFNEKISVADATPLHFTEEGTFQISVFEDLHYGEAEDLPWGPLQDIRSQTVMNKVLSLENPQLVVLNGDLITGENTFRENSSGYLDQIVHPLVQRGIPWASTFGNHDNDFNLSSWDILRKERRYPESRTQSMISGRNSGVTNYYIPVYYSGKHTSPSLLLWFFDSRGGNIYQKLDEQGNHIPEPSWVDESVVEWFKVTNAKLTDNGKLKIPSLAFVHIPVNAMRAFQKSGVDRNKQPGINDDDPLSQQGLVNGKDENGNPATSYNGQDIPFMSALAENPGMIALFSAHDHGDDWCFKWDRRLPGMNITGTGLHLCLGRHSGYGGYGTWIRGSRQILLRMDNPEETTKTWIRLEDGSVSGRVTLNSTYGVDKYPAVEA